MHLYNVATQREIGIGLAKVGNKRNKNYDCEGGTS